MIGRLAGTLLEIDPPFVLVDVAGVGYELEVPLSTLLELPRPGEPVTLVTHLAVKEDSHSLYGFLAKSDRVLFRTLLRVSGVGAKLALAILSGVSAAEFARLVADGNAAALTRLPGIGKKTAERLIVELRDKLGDFAPAGLDAGGLRAASAGAAPVAKDPIAEASAALGSLGYKPAEVDRMVRSAGSKEKTAEEIIRDALRGQVKP